MRHNRVASDSCKEPRERFNFGRKKEERPWSSSKQAKGSPARSDQKETTSLGEVIMTVRSVAVLRSPSAARRSQHAHILVSWLRLLALRPCLTAGLPLSVAIG